VFGLSNYITGIGFLTSTRRYERKQRKNEARYARFLEIMASDEYRRWRRKAVRKYRRLQRKYADVFNEIERWKLVFEDDFHGEALAKHWNTKPFWSLTQLSENYAQNVEMHNIDARYVQLSDSTLTLFTDQTNSRGLAWDETYGFIPRPFGYTSGTINTAGHFHLNPQQGKIEVKLRISSVKNVYHAFWLNNSTKTPAVSVFNFCNKKLETGVYYDEYDDKVCRRVTLSSKCFYTVQLEWDSRYITWRINGKRIARRPNNIDVPLYLNFASGVVGKVHSGQLPAPFELERVAVFMAV
jgi:beta-glucanase (GH16 family)